MLKLKKFVHRYCWEKSRGYHWSILIILFYQLDGYICIWTNWPGTGWQFSNYIDNFRLICCLNKNLKYEYDNYYPKCIVDLRASLTWHRHNITGILLTVALNTITLLYITLSFTSKYVSICDKYKIKTL